MTDGLLSSLYGSATDLTQHAWPAQTGHFLRPMEQRKYQRFTDSSLVTFSSETIKGEGRLDNLSLGGAAILSEIGIARGEYLTVTITFAARAGAIEIELAPVRWVKAGSFGVEFIRIAPDSQERLKQYLNTLESTSTDAA